MIEYIEQKRINEKASGVVQQQRKRSTYTKKECVVLAPMVLLSAHGKCA